MILKEIQTFLLLSNPVLQCIWTNFYESSGVEVGDINSKFGFSPLDNGYLRLNNYRVPRKNLLMRFAQACKGIRLNPNREHV